MKFRYYKQFLSVALAGVLGVSGVSVPVMSASAGEIVAFEQVSRGASMENGLSYSASELNTTFNGTNVFEAPAADVGLFKENIKQASSIDISITFKPSSVSGFMNLLEICNSSKNNSSTSPSEELGLIVAQNGTVYLMTGGATGSTDWSVATGTAITAGNTYTLTLSLSGSGLSVQMNGGAAKTVSTDSTKNTKKFVQAFFGGNVSGYTDWKQNIDSVVVGGLKTGSCQTHANFKNFNGEITNVTIAGKYSTETPVGNGVAAVMFDAGALDNTWLFGGGVETQGRYEEVGGVRNFIGQFEEYVRWEKRVDSALYGMQRYTINAGKEGQDAAAFAERLPELIEKADPMAVAYLIGPEDYNGAGGLETFKGALGEIIDAALALKSGNGCAVIQYPHAAGDEALNAKIEAYMDAAREVINGYPADAKERIAVADHYARTNTESFKNDMLTEEGLLNAEGHYEIAKQFSEAVYGSSAGFPEITDNWTAEEAPDIYLDLMPEATASADSLKVTVNGLEGTEWRYSVVVGGEEIAGTASGNPFTIEKLPEGQEYELTVQTADGKTQLSPVTGTVTEGNTAQAPALTEMQQAIREKAEDKETPLTWVFMGDSITHAAAHTHGYDGVAQFFEKYLKEDLGRTNDIVVNTAVSGATAERTIANVEQRAAKYKPDIVSIMLGTNDKRSTSVLGAYKENLKSIVQAIRNANPEALIIFRSPTPGTNGWQGNLAGDNGVVALMKAAADEDGKILFVDQYTEWNKETAAYPYLFTSKYYYGDNTVHLGGPGQLRMAQQFIEECGLDTNTRIANLAYQFDYAETESDVKPAVEIADTQDGITVSKSALQAAYGTAETIGEITVTATDRDGRTFTKSSGLDGAEVAMSLPTSRNYELKVTANIQGSAAKHVTFTGDSFLLTTGEEKDNLNAELASQEKIYNSNTDNYTAESVAAFRAAYEEAQKAAGEGVTDAEQLSRLTDALAKSAAALTEKAVVAGVQEVTVAGSKVTVPADAFYTASDVSWNAEKTSGSFTLTANDNARFDGSVRVTVSNAEALRIEKVNTEIKENNITVTLTIKKPVSDNNNQNRQPAQPTPAPVQPIAEGKVYDAGDYSYKVTSTSNLTAEVVGIKKAGLTKITVYNTVNLGGKDYKVTSIGASAFKGNKKVTGVSIGKNVQTIGKNAFAGCVKLKKAAIKGTGLKQIGSKAFYNCKALKSITIKSKSLKTVGKNAFRGIHKKAVIKVPKAKLTVYKNKTLKNKGQAKTVKIK